MKQQYCIDIYLYQYIIYSSCTIYQRPATFMQPKEPEDWPSSPRARTREWSWPWSIQTPVTLSLQIEKSHFLLQELSENREKKIDTVRNWKKRGCINKG